MFKFEAITPDNFSILQQLFGDSQKDWVSPPDDIWLSRLQNSTDHTAFLVHMLDEPIGYIEIFIESATNHSIRIAITKKYRGQGLGTDVLRDFIEKQPTNIVFIAYIEPDNLLSIKVFEKAGFSLSDTQNDQNLLKFVLDRSL